MRTLVTGRGTSGSWQIRGEQLGRAIGARVLRWRADFAPDPVEAAVVVWVKRRYDPGIAAIKRAGSFLVWDVVDAWPQPDGNNWGERQAREWVVDEIARIKPDAIVAPTARFKHDLERWGLFDPSLVLHLPHHAAPACYAQGPVIARRRRSLVLGYDGGPHYIARVGRLLEEACARRRWSFVVGPLGHACDLVACVRDHHGYPARFWKSNVKLANAQALGLPALCSLEAGYTETKTGAEVWCNPEPHAAHIDACLDALEDYEWRLREGARAYLATPLLPTIAARYRAWLESLDK